MWNARNLNELYARADRKLYLAFGGKTPLLADQWALSFPAGVWYVFTSGSPRRLYDDGSGIEGIGTTYRLNHDQSTVEAEASKLDVVSVDFAGGQVFLDKWTYAGDATPSVDVLPIHYSFALLTRKIQGRDLDVHLGLNPPPIWLPDEQARSSFVRSVFSATGLTPYLPPGRIHRHRRAVAEIAIEGPAEFRIKRDWLRYDCWRVHNCSDRPLQIWLEYPDGSAASGSIPPFECRAFRRKPDGGWLTSWGGNIGAPTCFFWPYLTGDIPFFAGGPPASWEESAGSGQALALERSQSANNLANPWSILEWQQAIRATLDPRTPYDVRGNYGQFYADPANDAALIGDCVHTWGRARLANAAEEKIIKIRSTGDLIRVLALEGIVCSVSGATLTVSNRSPWTRIYPLDCSVFQIAKDADAGNRYWDISPASPSFSVAYPNRYAVQPSPSTGWGNRWTGMTWSAVDAPSIFDTIDTLRRRVLVELGWLTAPDDVARIPEAWQVSPVTLTPLGLMIRVPSTTPVYDVGVQFDGTTEFEGFQNDSGLFPRYLQSGTAPAAPWNTDNFWSADQHVLLAPPLSVGGFVPQWRELFPTISTDLLGVAPVVWTAYVPAGGPWSYSRTVYDWEVNRVFELSTEGDTFSMGADFWRDKWGGAGGIDASVRVLGLPNSTEQVTTTEPALEAATPGTFLRPAGADDVWFDVWKPLRAGTTVIGYGAAHGFDGQTYIHHDPQDGASVHPYWPAYPYQFFQKIAKTAWLWDLLEYSVRDWRRIYRRVRGEYDIPVGQGRNLYDGLDAAGRGEEAAGYCQYLTFQGYSDLAALGLSVRDDGVNVSTPYYILLSDLGTWLSRNGFAYNLDVIAITGAYPSGVVVPYRTYGPAETAVDMSVYSVTYARTRSAQHRFVDLRLQQE
jgi:hypothetical protein